MPRRSFVLLLAALAIASSATPVDSQSHIMQVQRYVNGNPVAQGSMMVPEQAAAAISALTGDMTQPEADDRSLKLVAKAIPIVGLSKWKKKKKKHPLKSPLKSKFKLPLFLGGAAAVSTATKGGAAAATAANAANAATAAVAGLPLGLANLLGPGLITSALPNNAEVPIWKVHRYNGIDIRPMRLSELMSSPALPPPSELPQDFMPATGKAPDIPEPITPDTFPTTADAITFPSTPEQPKFPKDNVPAPVPNFVPAPVYGIPAPTYGVPAATYGVPAATYGPPAPQYGVPVPGYAVPIQGFSNQVSFPSDSTNIGSSDDTAETAEEDGNTAAGLEALSSLGALTDFLPGGGDGGSRLPSLFSLAGRGRGSPPFSFFNRFIRGQQPAESAQESQNTAYAAQPPSAIQNLLGRIPIISSLTNFGSGNTNSHVTLPPLPELPSVPDITNVQGLNTAFSQVPHVRLPTRYVLKGTPYTSIRYPQYQGRPVAGLAAPQELGEGFQASEQTESVAQPTAADSVEPVEPVLPEQSYPLPLEQSQVQPQPQSQFGYINSYGQPVVQTGYYVTPVISAPAPPQFTVPFFSTPVATAGLPAPTYGPPQDAAVAASEIDSAAVAVAVPATECADGNNCAIATEARFAKVAVPEGQTRPVKREQTAATMSPVFKKEEVKESPKTQEAEMVQDLARYLDPEHPAAAKTSTQQVDDSVVVDASPGTNTEEEMES